MDRRKFLIGTGSLAAGGAAVVGSGAVDSTQAERSVEVDVEGDAGAAYLQLDASDDSAFVNNSSPLSIDFAQDSGHGGSGVNNDGTTEARPGFEMKNQHSETMYIEANNPAASDLSGGGGIDLQLLAVKDANGFVGGSDNPVYLFDRSSRAQGFSPPNSRDPRSIRQKPGGGIQRNINGAQGPGYGGTDPVYLELGPGEALDVIVRVVARNASPGDDDIDGNIQIEAFDSESNTSHPAKYDPTFNS